MARFSWRKWFGFESNLNRHDALRRRSRPRLELLEDRLAPAAYTVNALTDTGAGSGFAGDLRYCINASNNNPGPGTNTISFDIPGSGTQTIQLLSTLPSITNPVVIDGTTQPGYSGTPLIEVNGFGAGSGANGLSITAGNSTVRGLVIDQFGQNGILLSGGGGDVIAGNYIGTDVSGSLNRGNGLSGVMILSSGNTVGGTGARDGNVISGNKGTRNSLPQLDGGVSIDSANNNLVEGNLIGTNASGTGALGNSGFGIVVAGTSTGNTIGGTAAGTRNIVSANGRSGIGLGLGATHDSVLGNYVGTDVTGNTAIGNAVNGIYIQFHGDANTIQGNVVSGNQIGINIIDANNNVVQGNLVGTNAAGTAALGNTGNSSGYGPGVAIFAQAGYTASSNLIGGTTAADRNVISANKAGVWIQGAAATGNMVQGNYIGTDVTGTLNLGNTGPGVELTAIDTGASGANNNTIGGTAPGAGNLIADNGGDGISLNNYNSVIGTTGSGVIDNRVTGNSIYNNGRLGIDLLSNSGVPVLNDSQGHAGPNNFQDFPVLQGAVSSSSDTAITGTFSEAAEPNTTITLDFYANSTTPAGYEEGQTYLGSAQVSTDANGTAPISVDLGTGNLAGEYITATATDPSGNTSEFDAGIQATAAPSGQSYDSAYLQSLLPQSSTTPNQLTIQTGTSLSQDTVIAAVNALTAPTQPVTIILNLNGGTYNDTTVHPPANVTLNIDGSNGTNTFVGHSPAFTVTGGNVVVRNVTFTTATDAPTILVTGGSLTLRNDDIEESTGFADAAISITGGTVDLGRTGNSGNNIIDINGQGTFIRNTTGTAIPLVGDTFEINGIHADIWTGGGYNYYWSNTGNWLNGVAPRPGDYLVFSDQFAPPSTPYNDIAVDVPYSGITLISQAPAYWNLQGAEVSLSGPDAVVNETDPVEGVYLQQNLLEMSVLLSGNATMHGVAGKLSALALAGGVNTNGYTLSLGSGYDAGPAFPDGWNGDQAESFDVQGLIAGAGSLVANARGSVNLYYDSYTGPTTIQSGTVHAFSSAALGAGTTVAAGAALELDNGASVSGPITLGGHLVGTTAQQATKKSKQGSVTPIPPTYVSSSVSGDVTLTSSTAHVDLSYTTDFATPLQLTPFSALFATDGTAVRGQSIIAPAHGSVVFNADGSFTYTPTFGYVGSDSFSYLDDSSKNVATVHLTISSPVFAHDQDYAVDENMLLQTVASYSSNGKFAKGGPQPGVLAGDADSLGNYPLTAQLVTGPVNGTLTLNSDGSFFYKPAINFVGTDSFTYKAVDSGGLVSNVATVTITVNPGAYADVWTGGGSDNHWTTAANWQSGVAPGAGDFLVFDAAKAVPGRTVNDFPADTSFAGITMANGVNYSSAWDLFGNQVDLGGPDALVITTTVPGTYSAVVTFELPIRLYSDAQFRYGDPQSYSNINLYGSIDTNGYNLTLGSGSAIPREQFALGAKVTGSGNLIANPSGAAGSVILYAANTYTGTTLVLRGTLYDSDPAGLGATNAGTEVGSGATVYAVAGSPIAEPITVDQGGLLSLNNQGYAGPIQLAGQLTGGRVPKITGDITLTATSAQITLAYSTDCQPSLQATPFGNVYDEQGNTLLANGVLVAGSTTSPAHGTVTLNSDGSFTYVPNAGFSGDDSFEYLDTLGDAYATMSIYVVRPIVSISAPTATYGNPAPITVTVASATGTPTGNVSLTVDGGSPVTRALVNGSSMFTISGFTAGDHSLIANYAGNLESSSNSGSIHINQATPSVTVSDAGGGYNGSSYPAMATVNGGTTLEGVGLTLSYYSGTYTNAAQLAGLTPLAGGPTAVGSYTVLAAFAGSADYTSATALASFSILPPPTAHLTSPTVAQAAGSTTVGFTLTATDPTPALQSGSFTYVINWGDGSSQTVTATATSGPLTHTYSAAKAYIVSATTEDQDGGLSAPATATVVVSTAAGDHVTLEDPTLAAGKPAGAVWVTWNGTITTYQPTDQVVVAGRGGTDLYTVDFSQLPVPVTVGAGGLTSGDRLVVKGVPNTTTNRITKTAGPAQGQGTITWTDGNPTTVTERIAFTGVPRVTINANGTKKNYVKDPGNDTTINGGPGDNTIEITATVGDGVVINGGPTTNTYIIDLGSLAGPVVIQNSNAGATDSLVVNGAAGDNTITVAGNQVTAGAQTITDTAALTSLTVNGGSGNNQITVSNLTVPVQNLAVNGGGGTNTITLVNLGASVSNLTVAGGSGTTQVQVQGTLPPNVQAQNVPPLVSAGNNMQAKEALTWTGAGSFTDTTAGLTFTATVNYGDGTGVQALPLSANHSFTLKHAYAEEGSYTVTVQVSDNQGHSGTGSFGATVTDPIGLLLLDRAGSGALTVSGTGSLVTQGEEAVILDSASTQAAVLSGSGSATAAEFDITGTPGVQTSGSAKVQGEVNAGFAALTDPLAALPVPAVPTTSFAAVHAAGSTSLTLQPGTYVGGISVAGSASVTLLPGLYYLQGGGLSVSNSGSLTGSGVVIYNAPASSSDGISVSGLGSVTLSPPASGTYQGISLFQSRTSAAAVNLTNSGVLSMSGTLYAAGAVVNVSGSARLTVQGNGVSAFPAQVIAADLSVTFGGTVVIGTPLPIQQGQTATANFWHGASGQQLLTSFNGGSSATALGSWLAANFANLYGSTAGSNNLAAMTNTQVASYFQGLYAAGSQSLAVQVLTTALNVYATTLSLGGTAAVGYGFLVTGDGAGASTSNVGSSGAAFGVANNATLSVWQLLLATNSRSRNGLFYNGDATLSGEALSVFVGLNQAGGLGS
jgi:hypothetical protein